MNETDTTTRLTKEELTEAVANGVFRGVALFAILAVIVLQTLDWLRGLFR